MGTGSDDFDQFSLSRNRDPWKRGLHRAPTATVTQKTPPPKPKTGAKTHWYRASRPESQSPDYFAEFEDISEDLFSANSAPPPQSEQDAQSSAGAGGEYIDSHPRNRRANIFTDQIAQRAKNSRGGLQVKMSTSQTATGTPQLFDFASQNLLTLMSDVDGSSCNSEENSGLGADNQEDQVMATANEDDDMALEKEADDMGTATDDDMPELVRLVDLDDWSDSEDDEDYEEGQVGEEDDDMDTETDGDMPDLARLVALEDWSDLEDDEDYEEAQGGEKQSKEDGEKEQEQEQEGEGKQNEEEGQYIEEQPNVIGKLALQLAYQLLTNL